MKTGRVIFFSVLRGYGFLKPDDGSSDLFVHLDTVQKAGLSCLTAGDNVSYEILVARNGKISAIDIAKTDQD